MKKSDDTALLDAALCKARSEMGPAILNRINPHFKSSYADLASVCEAVVPALCKYDIAISQGTTVIDGLTTIMRTELSHKNQWRASENLLTPGTPQSIGSQETYFRRYQLSSLCCIAADDDDDGEVAERSLNVPRETGGKKTAHKARPEWEPLLAEAMQIKTSHALSVWRVANNERLETWPDGWVRRFDERLAELHVKLRAVPSVKEQLQDSLAEEGEPD